MREAADELEGLYPQLEIDWAGGVCPFQAEGAFDGHRFYFRARHNFATLTVGGDLHFKSLYSAGCEFDDDPEADRGWLEPDEFIQIMRRLIPQLTRSQIYWKFPGVLDADTGVLKAGTPQTYGAWGSTVEEAWKHLNEPSAFLTGLGWSDEKQAAMRAAQQMRFEPLTVDDRVFPAGGLCLDSAV